MIQSYDNGRDAMRSALAAILTIDKRGRLKVPNGVVLAARIALEVEKEQAKAREETEEQWVASIERGSHSFLRGLFDVFNKTGEHG